MFSLANGCPLKDGVVVYAFRNLYNAITGNINKFDNNCNSTGARGVKQDKTFIRLKPKPVKSIIEHSSINVYPNPANDVINIEYNKKINRVNILDINGKLLLSQNKTTEINTSKIPNGYYVLKLLTDDGNIKFSKLLIQH
jgi:hypothetical protein